MLAIHLLLFGVSSRIVTFEEQENYTKDELLKKVKPIFNNYGNIFVQLLAIDCEFKIKYNYPNISQKSCAYFKYVCNQLTPATREFTYNETIEIEDFPNHNSLCLDCKTLNYFDRYIEIHEGDCYD